MLSRQRNAEGIMPSSAFIHTRLPGLVGAYRPFMKNLHDTCDNNAVGEVLFALKILSAHAIDVVEADARICGALTMYPAIAQEWRACIDFNAQAFA